MTTEPKPLSERLRKPLVIRGFAQRSTWLLL